MHKISNGFVPIDPPNKLLNKCEQIFPDIADRFDTELLN